jgi:hypothetical protein
MELAEIRRLIQPLSPTEKLQLIQFIATDLQKDERNQSGEPQIELAQELQQKILDLIASLPNMHDQITQKVLLLSAKIDQHIIQNIPLGLPPAQFAHTLVEILLREGTLADGRNALEAVLEATKQYLGADAKHRCDALIQEVRDLG